MSDDESESTGSVRRYVDYAILAGLLFLAFVAVVQFYLSVSAVISTWVTPEYRAPFRAVFNLAVLLAVGAVLTRHVRRMGSGEGDESASDDDSTNPAEQEESGDGDDAEDRTRENADRSEAPEDLFDGS